MKKMKMLVGMMLVATCLTSLVGCGASQKSAETTTEEQYYDQKFLNSMAAGLEARWKITNATDQKIENGEFTDEQIKETYIKCVKEEQKQISDYRNKKFKDSQLQEYALQYINGVDAQGQALKEYGSKNYDTKWSDAYNKRSEALAKIASAYKIPISGKYETSYNQLLSDGKGVEKLSNTMTQVDELLKNVDFKETKNEDGWKTYEAVVENTTDANFTDFSANVNLMDKDGVQVESQSVYVSDWNKGAKAKFTFETDKDFKTVNCVIDSWTDDQGNYGDATRAYQTEQSDIRVV